MSLKLMNQYPIMREVFLVIILLERTGIELEAVSSCMFGMINRFPIEKTWCLAVLRCSVLKSSDHIANPFLYALGIGLQIRTWTYLTSASYFFRDVTPTPES